jgi:hypothetical protein
MFRKFLVSVDNFCRRPKQNAKQIRLQPVWVSDDLYTNQQWKRPNRIKKPLPVIRYFALLHHTGQFFTGLNPQALLLNTKNSNHAAQGNAWRSTIRSFGR